MNQENLFIIFPAGVGGNHLANILSLSEQYATRFNADGYDGANRHTAHHAAARNLQIESLRPDLDHLHTQSNVFCGHWMEYDHFKNDGFADGFPNRKFCVIHVPEAAVRARNRFLSFMNVNKRDEDPWIMHELMSVYSVRAMKRLCDEPDSDWYEARADLLFSDDIQPLLNSLQSQSMRVQLDITLAQSIHTKWINNLKATGQI